MVNQANTQSDAGVSYYVCTTQSGEVTHAGRRIAGPFGSKEYAETVSDRMEDKQGYSTTSVQGEMA